MPKISIVFFMAFGILYPAQAIAGDFPKTPPLVSAISSQTMPAAPFGLEWGLSKEEIEARGIKLGQVPSNKGTQEFSATGLPKLIAGVEAVFIDLGFDNQLWKVAAVSEDFPNDPYGFNVKARYNELNEILAEKYGTGKAVHYTGESIYDEPRYFIAGISGGKNWHFTSYKNQGLDIQLSIRAKDSDTAYWLLIYTNTEMSKGQNKERANREKNAL